MATTGGTVTIPRESLEQLGLFEQYKAVIYVQLGIVIWEYLTTTPWEWSVFLGRRPFRKPMVIFFLARYSMWLAIVPNLVQLRTSESTDCRSVFDALTVGATLQVVFGQLVFILRCLAIWEWAPWVIAIFLVELLPYIAFSFAIFQGTTTTSAPDLTPGMISCQISNYGWPFLVAYSLCVVVDMTTALLVTFKVLSIRKTLRSSLLQMFLREGLMYSALGLIPAIIALAFFGKNDNAAVRGAGLTLCSMLHAVLGCRAFISLDSYAERLPTSLQVRVKNGEMLDADTLARIAFHTGMPRDASGGAGAEDLQAISEAPHRGMFDVKSPPTGGGGGMGMGGGADRASSPWTRKLARLGQKFTSSSSASSAEEKGIHLRSTGLGLGLGLGNDLPSQQPPASSARQNSVGSLGEGRGRTTSGGAGAGAGALGRTTNAHRSGSGGGVKPTSFSGAPGVVPNLDGIVIASEQVVEAQAGDDDDPAAGGGFVASPVPLAPALPSWEHGSPRFTYSYGRRGSRSREAASTLSYEEGELKEDVKRSP